MNSIVVKEHAEGRPPLSLGVVGFALAALRSITPREIAYFLFISLLVAGLNLAWLLDALVMGKRDQLIMPNVIMPLLAVPFVLGAWVIADRSKGTWPRPLRLALGVMAGAALVVLCVPPIVGALGYDLTKDMYVDGKHDMPIPLWAWWLGNFLDVCFFTGIGVAVLETWRRRAAGQRALEEARQQQARLARELLESRLAAMQAQVEPHFLFDSLVDVQATYDRDAGHGADVMDRLITYLRVALPRLRESGSTVQAEADLLAAYLAVVAARHGGEPAVHFSIAAECANERFSPMLLLPLVQRAMRGGGPAGSVPKRVELAVRQEGKDLVAQLRIEAQGLCADDPELARVHDRLGGLYDGRARLTCHEPRPGLSEFTLCVPR
jgi:hypothetical protein